MAGFFHQWADRLILRNRYYLGKIHHKDVSWLAGAALCSCAKPLRPTFNSLC